MKFPHSTISFSEEDTSKIADALSSQLKKGDVVVLNGNLGAGKTFFIKEVLKSFNIYNVSSPSFAIVNEYEGDIKTYHFDFYRINRLEELYDIGVNDYLNDGSAIIFIEWGSFFSEILPHKRIEVEIIMNDDFSRQFNIKKYE